MTPGRQASIAAFVAAARDELRNRPDILADGPVRPYRQLADKLEDRITRGEFRAGRLPPAAELAEYYGVAASTAERALRVLVEEGAAYVVRGRRGGHYLT